MTDLTPRQAVLAYLGGDPVEPQVLRAALAHHLCAYEPIVDLASEVVECKSMIDELAGEILMQQTMLKEYIVLDKSRDRSPGSRAQPPCFSEERIMNPLAPTAADTPFNYRWIHSVGSFQLAP